LKHFALRFIFFDRKRKFKFHFIPMCLNVSTYRINMHDDEPDVIFVVIPHFLYETNIIFLRFMACWIYLYDCRMIFFFQFLYELRLYRLLVESYNVDNSYRLLVESYNVDNSYRLLVESYNVDIFKAIEN